MIELKGHWILIREINDADLPVLCEWRNDSRFINLCSTRRNQVPLEEFKKELSRDFERDRYLQCFIIRKNKPIGTIYAYSVNQTDGYAFITIYLMSDYEKKGYGVEAFTLFAFYLFQKLQLYKVYAEVYSYNKHSLDCLKKAGFLEEGRFRGHRLYQGKRYDLIRLAFFQEKLSELQKFVNFLTERR